MLKNNEYLNERIAHILQEIPIDFFFVLPGEKIIRGYNHQIMLNERTRDLLFERGLINDDSETKSNTMIVKNIPDGFAYMGNIFSDVYAVNDKEIELRNTGDIVLFYVK